jgi:hypothetical protein
MWSTKSQNLDLHFLYIVFSERISSIKRTSFSTFFLRSPCMKSLYCCQSITRDHVGDISFREHFGRFREGLFFKFFYQNKKVFVSTLAIFFMKYSWNISFNPLFVCLLKRSITSSFSCLNSNNWNDGHGLIKLYRYNHQKSLKIPKRS